MGIHLADQTRSFLGAILLGAALGLLYDVFRIVRIAFPAGKARLFVEDVLYFMVCAAASFLFLLTSSDGIVRVFLLIGELIGVVLFHSTLGILVMRVAQAIINAVKAVLRFLLRWILLPIWRVFYAIMSLFMRPARWIGKFVKNYLRKVKFRLKVRRIVVYNHLVGYLNKRIPAGASGENNAYGKRQEKTEKQKERFFTPVHLHIRGLRRRNAGGYAGDFGEPETGGRASRRKGRGAKNRQQRH